MHKPTPAPGIAPALTVAYVVKGFWNYLYEIDKTSPVVGEFEETRWGGEIALMGAVVDRADFVEGEWLRRMDTGEASFAGVWEYEVSEVFGEQLAIYAVAHKKLPDDDWCITKVAELAMAMEIGS